MATEDSPILKINNDCLSKIFRYLDLSELLIAGCVCQRFESISQMFYRTHRSVDFEELFIKFRKKKINQPELSEVFRQLEPHMIAMKIYDLSYQKTFARSEFSIRVFPNLQHLFLSDFNFLHEEYAQIFPALKQIVLCNDTFKLEKVANLWFKKLNHLKILKFNNIFDMTGVCLFELKGIEELKIIRCFKLQPKFFEHFCKLNPQLKKLTLDLCCMNIRTENWKKRNTLLEIITKYLKNLEELVIIDDLEDEEEFYEFSDDHIADTKYESLRDLPKITKLRVNVHVDKREVNYSQPRFLNFLEHFATNNQIKYLNLNQVEEGEGILNSMKQFSHLKVLILVNCYISFEVLFENISCATTLEELHLVNCNSISSRGLKEFIQKFRSLRLLNVGGYREFYIDFQIECADSYTSYFKEIEKGLHNRSQILEIAVNGDLLSGEESKSDAVTSFLDRTMGKVKIVSDAFTEYGAPKKTFHEWEEWQGGEQD